MSGRISREMLEALKKDDEELPRFPLYYNQYSKPDAEQNRKNYKAFVAERLKAEKAKAANENFEKQKRKKGSKTSKTSQKKPNTGRGISCLAKSKGKHAANAQSEDILSSESSSDGESYSTKNANMSPPSKVTLSKEAMKRVQDIHEEFEKERKEMEEMNKTLLNYCAAAAADDDIVVDKIDTYDPLMDDINVRVRIRGDILLKRIRRTDKLAEVFRYVAKEQNVPAVQMVIYHRDLPISVNDTPKSLEMKLAEICECVIFKPTSSFRDDKNCINVKLQSKDSRKIKTVISIHLIDPFSIMMKKYAEMKDLPLEKLVFEFDGDKLLPNETPLDVEMENDHVIDVKVIS